MSDSRDDAEFLDGDELGEEVGDDELPGTAGFPPDYPLGVDDPSLTAPDDVRTRELRRDVSDDEDAEAFVLVTPDDVDDVVDDEAQQIATAVDPGDLASPEEAALHVIEPSDLDLDDADGETFGGTRL
ncbi:MAG TPA: hypothetical protein VGC84_06225 [Ilumatobacteraceae bacterium]